MTVINKIMASLLLLTAISAQAIPPEHSNSSRPDCASNEPCGPSMGNGDPGAVAVPSPGTLALVGLGLTGLIIARKKRK